MSTTRKDRMAAHRAKMARKAKRVVQVGFTPIDDRQFGSVRMRLQFQGKPILPNIGRSTLSRTSIATGKLNGKPHQHARKIARNLRRAVAA